MESKRRRKRLQPSATILNRIQRALVGYVSYLATCDANTVFTEYTLYEPVLRVLAAQKYDVTCEFLCRGYENGRSEIDFVAKLKQRAIRKKSLIKIPLNQRCFAMEVKWARADRPAPSFKNDCEKLRWYRRKHPTHGSYLCLFGTHESFKKVKNTANLRQIGDDIKALWKVSQYSCRMYRATS
jgi:hypothetical protein